MTQKRAAAIHDISGFGKCSLTVALPILSAAGVETSVVPTSVLSTHTGGFPGYTFRDLTDDLPAFFSHWKSLGLHFDAIYTGYLGSCRQVEMIAEFINDFKAGDTFVVVDPAMADNGSLYKGFESHFPQKMTELIKKADCIVPNMTEAALLLGREYQPAPYTKEYIEDTLRALHRLSGASVVLTGVTWDSGELGAACFDGESISYHMSRKINKFFHGTGDVFASVLVSALLSGKTLNEATALSVEFTVEAIEKTLLNNPERTYGVNFEQQLPMLIERLGLL